MTDHKYIYIFLIYAGGQWFTLMTLDIWQVFENTEIRNIFFFFKKSALGGIYGLSSKSFLCCFVLILWKLLSGGDYVIIKATRKPCVSKLRERKGVVFFSATYHKSTTSISRSISTSGSVTKVKGSISAIHTYTRYLNICNTRAHAN